MDIETNGSLLLRTEKPPDSHPDLKVENQSEEAVEGHGASTMGPVPSFPQRHTNHLRGVTCHSTLVAVLWIP